MAIYTQLAAGNRRVQLRRKTRYVAKTFRRRKDGEEWAREMERLSRPHKDVAHGRTDG
jgi:hypothetical protein